LHFSELLESALGRVRTTLKESKKTGSAQLPRLTVLILWFTTFLVFLLVVSIFRNYFSLVDQFGDNSDYITIAYAIKHWSFQEDLSIKWFWGLSYLVAAVSLFTGASLRTALLLISTLASFATIALACKLWGNWVASFFTLLNFDWIQRSFLGGSDSLFMLLLCGTFLFVRRRYWLLAALFASLSTVVRPVGLFALVAIALTLAHRREFKLLIAVTLIGLTVGGLYTLPLMTYFGGGFSNIVGYRADWDSNLPISWPLYAIIKGTILYPRTTPWAKLVLDYGWIILILLGIIAMFTTKAFRQFARNYPVEALFAVIYGIFIYSYNSPFWTRAIFPRIALPVLPFVLIALDRWLPKNKFVLWMLGFISPMLAAASAVKIGNVMELATQ